MEPKEPGRHGGGQDYLAHRNERRRGLWGWRWGINGGSHWWRAHDAFDLRDDAGRAAWREIEQRVREVLARES